jgi:hypothetical protein
MRVVSLAAAVQLRQKDVRPDHAITLAGGVKRYRRGSFGCTS